MITAVIFDLDGLIIDSETPDVLAWQTVYARYGLSFPVDSWLQNIGRTDGPFDAYEPFRRPGSPATPEAVAAIWGEHHDRLIEEYFKPLPGVVTLLGSLRRRGLRTAVASSSRRSWIRRVLTGLDLDAQFDAEAGGDEVPRASQAPDVYLLAARRLGAPPEACAALEDSANGVLAAKAAGMACVAVPSALTRPMDFSAADLVVSSLEEVTVETVVALKA